MQRMEFNSVSSQLYKNKKNGQLSLVLSKKDIKKNKELVEEFLVKSPKKVVVYFWRVEK